jgi:hypothetical protein
LVVAQIVLPGIAGDRLRDRLAPHGAVQQASVSAFPAIELLWGDAGSVTVRMRVYHDAVTSEASSSHSGAAAISPSRRLANLLAGTARTESLDARIGVLQSGRLVLDNVVLTKSGNDLRASALLTQSNLDAALPPLFTLRPLSSTSGVLEFRGTVHVLSTTLSVTAVLRAHDGALVVSPDLAGFVPTFLSLTVFSDPRVSIDSVGALKVSDGWEVSARAHLTG